MISKEDVEEATDALSDIASTRKSVSLSNERRTALINLRISEATDEEPNDNVTGNGVKLKANKSSSSLSSAKKTLAKPSSRIVKGRRGRVVRHSYSESNCSSNSARSGENGASTNEVILPHAKLFTEEKKKKEETYDEVFQANTSTNLAINSELMVHPSSPPSTASTGSNLALRRQSSVTSPKTRIKNYEYEFGEKLVMGNNARVKMMIEVFDQLTNEQIEGCFICFKGDLVGVHHRPPVVYLAITNHGLYMLNPVHEHHSIFSLDHSVKLSQIKCLETDINRLGLVIDHDKINDRTHYRIITCTGTISNAIIDLIHKTCNKNGLAPPEIVTRKESSKQMILKCFLSTYSSLDLEDIVLIHVSYVFWSRSHQTMSLMSNFDELSSLSSSYENCTGYKEGMLMYQLVEDREPGNEPNIKSGVWKAGYFILKHGYVYCYESNHKSRLLFFGQLFNNRCKGCRRVVEEDENYSIARPNVIEVKFIDDDHKLCFLYLAVPSEAETTDWIMNILNEVDLYLNDLLGTYDSSSNHNSWEKLVSLVLTEDSILVLVNNQNQSNDPIDSSSLESSNPVIANLFKSPLPFTVLGCINISDVLAVYTDDQTSQRMSSFTFIIIEYENTSSTASMGQGNFKWKLFFVNSVERNLFLDKLSRCWSQLFQVQLQVIQLDDSIGTCAEDEDEDVYDSRQGLRRISSWYRDILLNVSD